MEFQIEKSRDNYNIARVVKGDKIQYIGSKYCEQREIDKFINSLGEIKDGYTYIIFGLVLGEHIDFLKNKLKKNNNVLIIEHNKEFIYYCKNNKRIKGIFDDARFNIVSELYEVEEFFLNNINELNIHNLKVGVYGTYEKIFFEEIQIYYNLIKDITAKITINRNTKLYYADMWLDLFFANIKYIADGTPINSLKDQLNNVPAIVVSAGPSLSKNIGQLKNIKNAVILSGGRTLNALMNISVEPNVLCVIDPIEDSYKLVEKHISKVKCPLVFYEGTNDKIVREHRGNKLFSTNSRLVKNVWGSEILSLGCGGSVAHSMTMLAAYMGCNPIIFVGQDLAYTNERGHADCAENYWEEVRFEKFKRNDDIYVDDIYGNRVRTSIELNNFRISLENIIAKYPNINFINATEGGVNIKGTENKKLKDALELIKHINNKTELCEKKLCNKSVEIMVELKRNYSILKSCLKDNQGRSFNLNTLKGLINELTIPTEILFKVHFECERLNLNNNEKSKYIYDKLVMIRNKIKTYIQE